MVCIWPMYWVIDLQVWLAFPLISFIVPYKMSIEEIWLVMTHGQGEIPLKPLQIRPAWPRCNEPLLLRNQSEYLRFLFLSTRNRGEMVSKDIICMLAAVELGLWSSHDGFIVWENVCSCISTDLCHENSMLESQSGLLTHTWDLNEGTKHWN